MNFVLYYGCLLVIVTSFDIDNISLYHIIPQLTRHPVKVNTQPVIMTLAACPTGVITLLVLMGFPGMINWIARVHAHTNAAAAAADNSILL